MSELVEWDDGPEPSGYVPSLLDAAVAGDDVAAWAATVTPGTAVISSLAVLDPARLSHEGRVDALAAMERHISWIQARQHRLLAVMATDPAVATPAGELERHWVTEEVACALRLSGVTAADRLAQATALSRLPATLDLLEHGAISTHHARAVAQAVLGLDPAVATVVEAAVLGNAPQQSLAEFRRSLSKAVLAAAPRSAEERHQQAVSERRVVRTPDRDGMSQIWMLLPDPGAATIMTVIDALARRVTAGDPRTADQRRADAVVQIAINTLHGTATAELPREHRMRPSVHISVALSTLLGLDDQPGELGGTGPIPAALARHIAADPSGTWRRLVTDEMGRLIDYGRATYRPPTELTEHIMARDRTCRFRHCNRQARHCHLDHRQPWDRHGPTNAANLHTLCSRHHHAKHQAHWTPTRQPDGTTQWTSPTRHTYLKQPDTYPIDHTAQPTSPHPNNDVNNDPDPPPF